MCRVVLVLMMVLLCLVVVGGLWLVGLVGLLGCWRVLGWMLGCVVIWGMLGMSGVVVVWLLIVFRRWWLMAVFRVLCGRVSLSCLVCCSGGWVRSGFWGSG